MKKENKKIPEFASVNITAKAVILNSDGKVLVLRRSKKTRNYPGAYDLPGGHIDKGETVNECLEREIEEETGLNVEMGDVIAVREFPRDHEMFDKKKALRFVATAKSEEVELNEREHEEFEWMTFEDVEKKLQAEGYEAEKRETIMKAKEYLEMQKGLDGWKRCLAEFDNYKKIQAESNKSTVKYATENIVMQILPVIDNFSASIDHIPEDQKDGPWVTGIMYIKKQLEDILKENGIEEIDVKVGDEFDSEICEAIEAKNNKKSGGDKIEKVILKGYKIGDRVIRPAKVSVK